MREESWTRRWALASLHGPQILRQAREAEKALLTFDILPTDHTKQPHLGTARLHFYLEHGLARDHLAWVGRWEAKGAE